MTCEELPTNMTLLIQCMALGPHDVYARVSGWPATEQAVFLGDCVGAIRRVAADNGTKAIIIAPANEAEVSRDGAVLLKAMLSAETRDAADEAATAALLVDGPMVIDGCVEAALHLLATMTEEDPDV